MLNLGEVNRIASKAATAALKGVDLSKVYGEPSIDSNGLEALNITIVFRSFGELKITGDTALDAIVRIQHDLTNAGEERLPIVYFITEDEIKLNGNA